MRSKRNRTTDSMHHRFNASYLDERISSQSCSAALSRARPKALLKGEVVGLLTNTPHDREPLPVRRRGHERHKPVLQLRRPPNRPRVREERRARLGDSSERLHPSEGDSAEWLPRARRRRQLCEFGFRAVWAVWVEGKRRWFFAPHRAPRHNPHL